MQDKTPIYMVIIVAVVALVALVIILSGNNVTNTGAADQASITGNIVANTGGSASLSLNAFGKIFFAIFLLGIVTYLYFRTEN